jgi:hypothetical protein
MYVSTATLLFFISTNHGKDLVHSFEHDVLFLLFLVQHVSCFWCLMPMRTAYLLVVDRTLTATWFIYTRYYLLVEECMVKAATHGI